MKKFIQQEKTAPPLNSFLVADRISHPDHEYWVYWPQTRQILLVGWPAEDCKSPHLLIRKRLDLTQDTVASETEIRGSTYVVTDDWARTLIYSAAKQGYEISVRK